MSPARRMLVLTAMLGCVAHVRDARACSEEPTSAIRGFAVMPADGTDDAPTNTRIWVSSMRGYETLPPSAFSVEFSRTEEWPRRSASGSMRKRSATPTPAPIAPGAT